MKDMKRQTGFTLVEIAIVLVIVGLILGGVLKGQEMIANAKVRNVIDQSTGIQTAVFAFQDRYRGLPGDYSQATTNIPGVAGDGNGNGFITTNAERGLFWQHLSTAGFITGNYNGAAAANNLTCNSVTCASNAFNGAMMFSWGAMASGETSNAHELRIGRSIPVDIVAEIDRKIDDGAPDTGSFQLDDQANAGTCKSSATVYDIAGAQQDCGGVRRN